jgi:hypothetical protein
VGAGERLLDAVLEEFPSGSSVAAEWARLRTGWRFQAELVEASRRVGRSWREVMLANVSYDLALIAIGCSTAAVATAEGPVLARNLDWWPERELIEAAEVVDTGDQVRATWPGFVGAVTGMSRRGFALAINAVTCDERAGLRGYPILLFLRRVLDEARGFAHALEMLTRQRLAASALLTLVGTRNEERVVVERTPSKAVLRWPEGDAPLVATNDYRAMDASGQPVGHDLYATSCGRFEALSERLRELDPGRAHGDAELVAALRDRRVLQDITVQHVVARPSAGVARAWVPAVGPFTP